MENAPKAKPPAYKARLGAITAVTWENTFSLQGKEVTNFSVKVSRSYKDKSGNWQDTDSFRVNDLPKVMAVLNETYLWICRGGGGKAAAETIRQDDAEAYL